MKLLRRTWADIDLDKLEHNYRVIRAHVGKTPKFLGVMKADAYGHGSVPLSKYLAELGAEYLAVSNLEEAVQIRRGEVREPILILGYTPPSYAEMMVFMDITQEVHSLEYACLLDEALKGTNYILNIHLKIDTGMTRIGFSSEDTELTAQMEKLKKLSHLHVEGAFTHFSCADSLRKDDVEYTKMQHGRFLRVLQMLESLGIEPEIRHCCNSGAVILHPEYAMDMVRPGILTYGVHPSQDTEGVLDLQPVMTLRSMVAQIRDIKAGAQISYGRTFTAQKDLRMAVVPIGYADGLSRALSGKASFIIRGQQAPIVGRICMDMCMVDVSHLPEISVGDTVTVFGEENGCDDLARLTGTIPYEVLCAVNKRIPRIYLSGGKESSVLQYIV